MIFRRWAWLWLVVVATVARAQPTAPQFDVFAGFSEHAREGAWFPVVCEIQNNGPAFSGVVQVSPERGGGDRTIRVAVDLPTGTRKRLLVPVFAGQRGGEWRVVLLDEREKVRAEHQTRAFQVLQAEVPLVGALTRGAATVPAMVGPRSRSSELAPTVVRLQADHFPENPIVLQSLTAIYLNSERAAALRPGQVDALLTWLESGGHLIVGIDQIGQVAAQPWLSGLVSADLETVKAVPAAAALAEWSRELEREWDEVDRRSGQPVEGKVAAAFLEKRKMAPDAEFGEASIPVVQARVRGGRVELASGGEPLIVSSERGRGRVSVLFFDPERDPFFSFAGRPWFWTRLLGVPSSLYAGPEVQRYGRQPIEGAVGSVIETKQVRKLSLGWLLLLLLAYVVIIGPVDYVLIRRLKRPMLTWITFPAYVAAFSAIIYITGYSLRAGRTEWNEVSVVDIQPRGSQAVLVGKTFGTIYSPANDTYAVAGERRFAAFRHEASAFFGGSSEGSSSVQMEGNQFTGRVFVPVWVSQMFVTDWVDTGTAPVDLSVKPTADGWSYRVSNLADRPLGPVRVAVGDRYVDLPRIEARAAAEGRVLRAGPSLAADLRNQAGSLQQAMQARRASFNSNPGMTAGSPETVLLAASFVDELNANMPQNPQFAPVQGINLSPMLRRGQAVLVAMDAQPLDGPLVPRFDAALLQRQTVWRLVVPVETAP